MISEKNARKREEAVMNAMKPQFEKVGRGLDYIQELLEQRQKSEAILQQSTQEILETEREINNADRKATQELEQKRQRQLQQLEWEQKKQSRRMNDVFASMAIQCECGCVMSPIQMVCHKCGRISSIFPYESDEEEVQEEVIWNELVGLQEGIETIQPIKVPFENAQDKAAVMHRISAIAQSYQKLERAERRKELFASIQEKADAFIDRCQDTHIEVAVVGNVKAGKSTLINALLGARLASTDATPETSTLVKYRTTAGKSYIKVSFYTSEEWKKVWESTGNNFKKTFQNFKDNAANCAQKLYLDRKTQYSEISDPEELRKAIMRWTSKDFADHYFVKELEVGYHGKLFPHDVVLVDTPGLNDPVAYRSEMASEYIQHADWVLACIPGDPTEMCAAPTYKFLINDIRSKLQHRSDKMMIVATGADKLPAEERSKLQSQFLANLKEESGESQGKWNERFVFASPLVHLLKLEWENQILSEDDDLFDTVLEMAPRKFGFKKCTITDLDAVGLSEFQKRLGVETIKQLLSDKVFSDVREQLREKVKDDYERTMNEICSMARSNLYDEFESLTEIQTDASNYRRKKEELQRQSQDIEKSLDDIRKLLSRM